MMRSFLRTTLVVLLVLVPVPVGAVSLLHVASNGDDAAVGSAHEPLRSVARAIARISPGGTIVVHGGTYRESLPDLDKPVTLRSRAGERARLKGSRIVGKWERHRHGWVRRDWSSPFCVDCYHPGNIDPNHPFAGRPDQLFVDGRPMRRVRMGRPLRTGEFAIDGTSRTLLLGSDPRGRRVEASVHSHALTIRAGGEGSRVVGLDFLHYAPTAEPGLGGMVRADTHDLVFEDNLFAFSAVKGLSVFARDVVVRNNTFRGNGMMGLEAWRADRLVVEGNRFVANNRKRFVRTGTVSEAAGAKITTSRDVRVSGNDFVRNLATGLWLDIDVLDAAVLRNGFTENTHHGLHFEISAGATIAGNRFAANGKAGLALADARGARVWNNTFENNPIAVVVQDDARDQPDAAMRARGNSWSSGGHRFANNLIKGGTAFWVRDFTGRLRPGEMLGEGGANAVERPRGRPVAIRWRDGRREAFEDLPSFLRANGSDTTTPDAPVPTTLPPDIASALSVLPGSVGFGALGPVGTTGRR